MLEITAAALGAISVWLVVKRNILAFPIGIVMVLLYFWIFFQAKLYSDMLLQLFFAAMQVHGWLEWKKGDKATDEKIVVYELSEKQWWLTGGLLFPGFLALGWLMDTQTDAASPYVDAFVTVQSVLAQWWMNKRYLENWVLWFGTNQVAMFLYASKQLFFTAGLYALFMVMAAAGYLEWRRIFRGTNSLP